MKLHKRDVEFIKDGLTAIFIVAGLLFMFWGLSQLPMHHYGGVK
jgi:hypothetical protein